MLSQQHFCAIDHLLIYIVSVSFLRIRWGLGQDQKGKVFAKHSCAPDRLPVVSGSVLARHWPSESQNTTGALLEDERPRNRTRENSAGFETRRSSGAEGPPGLRLAACSGERGLVSDEETTCGEASCKEVRTLEEPTSTKEEKAAAAAAGRTTMLSCCFSWPVMRTGERGVVEGGSDEKGWAAGRCAAGDVRWKVAAPAWRHQLLPTCSGPRVTGEKHLPGVAGSPPRLLAKMASPFVNNLTQNGRLSIRRAEPGRGGIA